MLELGPILQRLREVQGYTQAGLAEKLSAQCGRQVNERQVRYWESGHTEIRGFYFVHLLHLCNIRDINPYFFPDDAGVQLTPKDYQKISDFIGYLTYSRMKDGRDEKPATDTIDLYDTPAAAGPGQYLEGSTATKINRTSAVPAAADFAIWVRGDSMEPIVYDGQIAWVHQQRVLDDGEIGVFSHNGEGKIKKLAREGDDVYLISANSQYEPLPLLPDDELTVFGRVVGFCCPELISM